jgi:cell division protein FtsB
MPLQKVNAARDARQQALLAQRQALRHTIRALREQQRRRVAEAIAPAARARGGVR